MKKEIRIFFTALMFYSRIPCPKWVDHSEEYLNKATKYFPLIGWIMGGAAAFALWGGSMVLPHSLAVLLSIGITIWLTGAFHEDGFADMCDGFGGGWTKEKILMIMKDSRLGTYGAVGLLFVLASKFLLLYELSPGWGAMALLVGHPLSRFVAATFIYTHPYAREDAESKAKPVAQKGQLSLLVVAGVFGLLPMVVLGTLWAPVVLVLPFVAKGLLGRWFMKWIGGYTGDCLGATQQVAELLVYLSILLAVNHGLFP